MVTALLLAIAVQASPVVNADKPHTVQWWAESTQNFYPIGYGIFDNSMTDYYLMGSLSRPDPATPRGAVLVNIRSSTTETFQEIELFAINCTAKTAQETFRFAYKNGALLNNPGPPQGDDVSLLLQYVTGNMISQLCSGGFSGLVLTGKDLSYFR